MVNACGFALVMTRPEEMILWDERTVDLAHLGWDVGSWKAWSGFPCPPAPECTCKNTCHRD